MPDFDAETLRAAQVETAFVLRACVSEANNWARFTRSTEGNLAILTLLRCLLSSHTCCQGQSDRLRYACFSAGFSIANPMLISKKLVRAAITFEECARVASAISSVDRSSFDAYETMKRGAQGEAIQHSAHDLYGASDYMLAALPLGLRSDWSAEFSKGFDHFHSAVSAEYQLTAFWTEWLNSLADGEPLLSEMPIRVALIDDVIWDAGPYTVAREIARIQTEMALAALPQAQSNILTGRHGVGGNNPPEDIEDVQVLASSITLIWSATAGIEEEVASDTPDRDRVAACLQVLKTGSAAIAKWCGRKADLTVDTLINWGIPAGGGVFLATQPEKVAALVKAAEGWLRFLP